HFKVIDAQHLIVAQLCAGLGRVCRLSGRSSSHGTPHLRTADRWGGGRSDRPAATEFDYGSTSSWTRLICPSLTSKTLAAVDPRCESSENLTGANTPPVSTSPMVSSALRMFGPVSSSPSLSTFSMPSAMTCMVYQPCRWPRPSSSSDLPLLSRYSAGSFMPGFSTTGGVMGVTIMWPLAAFSPAVLMNSSLEHQFRQTIFISRFWSWISLATCAAGLATFWITTYSAPC